MRVDVKKLSIIILSGYISCLDIEIECVNFLRTTCIIRVGYTLCYTVRMIYEFVLYLRLYISLLICANTLILCIKFEGGLLVYSLPISKHTHKTLFFSLSLSFSSSLSFFLSLYGTCT